MDFSYKTVVNYVKNLVSGFAQIAPSDNPEMDAQVVFHLSNYVSYILARNGHRYWYCFVDSENVPLVKYVLRSNGVNVSKHESRYFISSEPALRVRARKLSKNPDAKLFVDKVMNLVTTDAPKVNMRIEHLKQKIK